MLVFPATPSVGIGASFQTDGQMDGQIDEIVTFMTFSSKIRFISHKLNLKNVLYMRAYDLSFMFIDMIELMGNNGH